MPPPKALPMAPPKETPLPKAPSKEMPPPKAPPMAPPKEAPLPKAPLAAVAGAPPPGPKRVIAPSRAPASSRALGK